MARAIGWVGGYLLALAWDFGVCIAVASTRIASRPGWTLALVLVAVLAAPLIWWRALRKRGRPILGAFAGGLGFGGILAAIYAVLVALWLADIVALYLFPLGHPVVLALYFGGPALWFGWISLLHTIGTARR